MNALSKRNLLTLTIGTLSLTLAGQDVLAQQDKPQGQQPGQAQPQQPGAGASPQAAPQKAAQPQRPLTESADEARKRTDKTRQVSGTILSLKNVGIRGSDVQNRVALIRTNKGNKRMVVDLGQQQELKGLNISEGQRIALQGRVVRVGDRQLLVAQSVKQNDQTRQLQRTAQARAMQQPQKGSSGQEGGGGKK